MRLVIQRVRSGSVSVGNQLVAQIGRGFVILVGVGLEDDEEKARFLAEKTAFLRVFEDQVGKMNRSLLDIGGEALVVSQFTLYADTRKGRRPSFTAAALPEQAKPLVECYAHHLQKLGVPTQCGQFGAHMLVRIDNDGPVTILLEQ